MSDRATLVWCDERGGHEGTRSSVSLEDEFGRLRKAACSVVKTWEFTRIPEGPGGGFEVRERWTGSVSRSLSRPQRESRGGGRVSCRRACGPPRTFPVSADCNCQAELKMQFWGYLCIPELLPKKSPAWLPKLSL